jgi:hypothetical protein
MTDPKSTPKADGPKTPAKPAVKDEDVKTGTDASNAKGGKDVSGDQKVMERDDIGAAAGPGKPETVKVITEVRPGVAN